MNLAEVDISGLIIDQAGISSAGRFDSIAVVNRPRRTRLSDFVSLSGDALVVVVSRDGEDLAAVAYSTALLAEHQVIQDVIGGQAIAVTYDPQFASIMVFHRTMIAKNDAGEPVTKTLNFGVSGLVERGGLLLFDKTNRALWSQLRARCVSGPNAGTRLRTLPFSVMTWSECRARFPEGEVAAAEINTNAPHDVGGGEDSGIGVLDFEGRRTWFLRVASLNAPSATLQTSKGDVRIVSAPGGFAIESKPEGIEVVQTLLSAWIVIHPETEVVTSEDFD